MITLRNYHHFCINVVREHVLLGGFNPLRSCLGGVLSISNPFSKCFKGSCYSTHLPKIITSALIHPQNITAKALANRNNKNDNFIFVIIVMGGLKHV